jgi:hypothetical protein
MYAHSGSIDTDPSNPEEVAPAMTFVIPAIRGQMAKSANAVDASRSSFAPITPVTY